VLAGGYWVRDYRGEPDYADKTRVHIFATGVMLPEALHASDAVREMTSTPRHQRHQPRSALYGWLEPTATAPSYLDELIPPGGGVPSISVIDGHR
jgi:hypothetical protein